MVQQFAISKSRYAIALGLSGLLLLASCSTPSSLADNPKSISEAFSSPEGKTATAIINSTADPSQKMGEATFTSMNAGLEIAVQFEDVPPGKHGFHIHEVGSCEDGGKAAKGHFNPNGVEHGYLPEDGVENAHGGDLGNVEIAEDGTGTLTLTIPQLSLEDGTNKVAGLSVILHEKLDDFGQPTGHAGGRIGCGRIS
ncbi:superoxide dismutase family protein [Lusitaniella coriacea]|nr:superoxide dismutase family protein [Lusitaniella coriacea]